MTANARRIKARADENLKHLPNYTCTETIQRSLRTSRRDRLRPTDTVHLDVAYVGGKELFGRPGEHRIDQPDVAQLVTKPIGNGQFALFAKSIFLGQRAKFGPPVNTRRAGKQAYRYDYTIPVAQSGFRIQSAVGEAIVGYSGSLWVTTVPSPSADSFFLCRCAPSGKPEMCSEKQAGT